MNLYCPKCKQSDLSKTVEYSESGEKYYYWDGTDWEYDNSDNGNFQENETITCDNCNIEIDSDDLLESLEIEQ